MLCLSHAHNRVVGQEMNPGEPAAQKEWASVCVAELNRSVGGSLEPGGGLRARAAPDLCRALAARLNPESPLDISGDGCDADPHQDQVGDQEVRIARRVLADCRVEDGSAKSERAPITPLRLAGRTRGRSHFHLQVGQRLSKRRGQLSRVFRGGSSRTLR